MLQFVWRDLTSKFDIIGPYYSSSESLKSKFILACVFEVMKIFQLYGFQTSVLVCDGASANLTALKTSTGVSGAYGVSSLPNQHHKIPSPRFENPFNPPRMVYWICPSHQVCGNLNNSSTFQIHFLSLLQLKNMINALFSLKHNGTKAFEPTLVGKKIQVSIQHILCGVCV